MTNFQPHIKPPSFRLSHHEDFDGSVLIPDKVVANFNRRIVRSSSDTACWIYPQRKPNPRSYSIAHWADRWGFQQHIGRHRLSLLQEIGPEALEGQYACHLCTVKNCVNPAHLYAGTALQNARDKMLMEEIEQRTGSTEGVVLPRHPGDGLLRSRFVCEEFISELKVQRMRDRLDPPTRSLSIGPFRGASVPLPSPRLRPARERTAQIR